MFMIRIAIQSELEMRRVSYAVLLQQYSGVDFSEELTRDDWEGTSSFQWVKPG